MHVYSVTTYSCPYTCSYRAILWSKINSTINNISPFVNGRRMLNFPGVVASSYIAKADPQVKVENYGYQLLQLDVESIKLIILKHQPL